MLLINSLVARSTVPLTKEDLSSELIAWSLSTEVFLTSISLPASDENAFWTNGNIHVAISYAPVSPWTRMQQLVVVMLLLMRLCDKQQQLNDRRIAVCYLFIEASSSHIKQL